LEIIRKKLQARCFNDDGTPTDWAYFEINNGYSYATGERVAVESFDVEILLSFDGKPEHFLVTYKPFVAGYTPGVIIGNKYYLLGSSHRNNSNNPFEENGIEKGNRYYHGVGRSGLVFIKDGAFTDLLSGYIYSKDEIKESLQSSRSRYGIHLMKTYWGSEL
jgi:hypothetical protein